MGDFDKMPDWDEILTGKCPWNSADFFKVSKMYHELLAKPCDDWNLKECDVKLQDEEGNIKNLSFTKFALETQLALFMKKELGNEVFIKQFPRFMEIFYFIEEHKDELEKEKLIIKGNGSNAIDDDLIEALCVLPFDKKIIRKSNETFSFDFMIVVEKVKKFKVNGNK